MLLEGIVLEDAISSGNELSAEEYTNLGIQLVELNLQPAVRRGAIGCSVSKYRLFA